MAVKLLLSQPAGGKTTSCIDRILEIRRKDPFSPVKVIVPDKMQMAYWKQTLARKSWKPGLKGNGFIGTEVISISKLAVEILNSVSGSPDLIPASLDSLCVREAVNAAAAKEPFAYFQPIRERPGLLSVFEQTIHTLMHGRITPEMLENVSGEDPKAADTARVYREYLAFLQKNNWIGAAGLLNAAADILVRNSDAFPHCPLLVVDGYNELDRDCINLLKILSGSCGEMLITLPARENPENPTEKRVRDHADLLRTELNAVIAVPESHKQSSGILNLADSVFYPSSNRTERSVTVSKDEFLMIEASSRTTEVREALRELKQRIILHEIRPADCAVYVPDMNAYAPIIRQFGREMGIPMRFSQRQKLSESPAASALKRLLHLYPDFETLPVLSVLRLPFFSGNPDPNDGPDGNYGADLFVVDQIGRKMNVISGTSEWETAFSDAGKTASETWKKGRNDADDADSSEDGKVYEYPEPEKLERIKESFLKFAGLLTPPEGRHSRAEWIRWLEDLLETIGFYKHIEDRKGRSFESDFRMLLKRIAFCEEKLSRPAVPYEEFILELENEMDAAEQTEPEYAGDRVFVGDISQTSGCRWKLIILTGFAEGVFPRAGHEDLILTSELRAKLGLPPEMDQQMLFHHAVTRSETGLVITRPQKTDKGEEWPPSIYWQTIRGSLGKGKNLKTVTENMTVTASSPEEFAFRLARSGQHAVPAGISDAASEKIGELLDSAWNELDTMISQTEGTYAQEGDDGLKNAIADPVKDAVPYSCSAIETWLTCPFRYFLTRKLKLEQPQEPGTGLDAAQIGTLNHKVMELTFTPGTVFSSREEALERANKNIDYVFAGAPKDFGFRESELWQFEKEKYRKKLLDTIDRMFTVKSAKMPVDSSWTSVGTEMKFGYPGEGENTDPLTVETEAGPIRIRGIIDRVDRKDNGLMRVVDYKTSFGSFKTEALKEGSHIQAGIYAAAVVHALELGSRCEGMYWSINDQSVREYVMYDPEQNSEIPNIEFLNRFAAGIRDASYPAKPAGGDCPDYCPAAGWCRKFARRKYHG